LDQLEFDAKKAYYDVLLTRALVRVAEESVKTFERHLADTQQMLDVGLVSNFEVLRAKTEVGSRQADRVSARNGERLALVNLRRIIGLPQDAPAYLEGKTGLELTNETIEQLLPTAAQERPELKTLDKAILAAQQGVRRAKGEYYPRAAATIDYTHMDGGVASMMSSQGWTFTVAGQWDLYAGGKRKHDVAEQKATLSGLEYQRIDVAQLVELDVRSAFIQMQDALAKVGEQKGTVDLAREGKRLADLRYQEGVSTQVETLDADLALTRAETALVMALHDYAVALASLDKAVSRSWVARDTEDQPACKEAAK
jgi:outer membrane protein TolC